MPQVKSTSYKYKNEQQYYDYCTFLVKVVNEGRLLMKLFTSSIFKSLL